MFSQNAVYRLDRPQSLMVECVGWVFIERGGSHQNIKKQQNFFINKSWHADGVLGCLLGVFVCFDIPIFTWKLAVSCLFCCADHDVALFYNLVQFPLWVYIWWHNQNWGTLHLGGGWKKGDGLACGWLRVNGIKRQNLKMSLKNRFSELTWHQPENKLVKVTKKEMGFSIFLRLHSDIQRKLIPANPIA